MAIPPKPTRRETHREAWTVEEDQKLGQAIEIHGPKRWKSLALKAGLNRCGKSCGLRWMNYLNPNIKRGNISDQEEDLILRLHKLLGNRWTLIAGRVSGRTDNEIKNYWNSHLSKKNKQIERSGKGNLYLSPVQSSLEINKSVDTGLVRRLDRNETNSSLFRDVDQFFDFANEGPMNLEWMSSVFFPEVDEIEI